MQGRCNCRLLRRVCEYPGIGFREGRSKRANLHLAGEEWSEELTPYR
jgi:hypothetical protein